MNYFTETIEFVGITIDAVGVGAIVIGALISTAKLLNQLRLKYGFDLAYREYRKGLGRAILLGLEFLVAADIIRTVAISPSFTSVGILGIIVLIRTFLSMTLEIELTGRLPWVPEKVSEK